MAGVIGSGRAFVSLRLPSVSRWVINALLFLCYFCCPNDESAALYGSARWCLCMHWQALPVFVFDVVVGIAEILELHPCYLQPTLQPKSLGSVHFALFSVCFLIFGSRKDACVMLRDR